MRARPRVERRHGVKGFAKTGDILLEYDVHRGGNAPCCRIVNSVTRRVGRISNENTTKRFRIQFFALGNWNFSKCRTTKHSEPRSIWGSECEESEGNSTAGANCTTESAVAEVDNGAHGAGPHGRGHGHGVHARSSAITDGASWTFSLTEHVMRIGG